MKFKNLAIFSFLTISLLSGCSDKEKIDENIVVKKTETIKEHKVENKKPKNFTFHLKTSTGKEIKIITTQKGWKFEGAENKVVLVDFFGTWCPPCKAEIPHLNHIRKQLKKDFEIIGIDVGNRGGGATDADKLTAFIKKFNIKYPVTTGADNGKLFGAVSNLNENGSIPFMILFNKKGEFVQYYIGMTPEEMLMEDIKQAIKMK